MGKKQKFLMLVQTAITIMFTNRAQKSVTIDSSHGRDHSLEAAEIMYIAMKIPEEEIPSDSITACKTFIETIDKRGTEPLKEQEEIPAWFGDCLVK